MQVRTISSNKLTIPWEDEKQNPKPEETKEFSALLGDALNKVNQLQMEKDEYKELLVTGGIDNLHDVTIAGEKANIALQLTLSIRNKVVEAYREIMRMQI
ncbi:flagellar hook-basal body complex protein FliE [Clostridium sp. Cult3]|uniref:flagellar hook-basal body complex protein FliE n=1 Tax=Clostridium sp. Cult3 TaxID=2079004 RepID=UPI001F019D6D|nr:flagellar hook-basal body complex protein FliE [Clostridium sp. Cult3]MCF6460551.1 flagellar hook-basal body complex protein FliE [Clostridium sp. Cult3]